MKGRIVYLLLATGQAKNVSVVTYWYEWRRGMAFNWRLSRIKWAQDNFVFFF